MNKMKTFMKVNNNVVTFGIPILIIASLILVTTSRVFMQNVDVFSTAITIDLLLTVPIIYFLLIRKKNIPKFTVVSVFVIGIIISSFIIPKENQYLLSTIKTWILPFVEIGIAGFIIFNVRSARKRFRSNQYISTDFFTILKHTCEEILPKKIAIFLAMEIAVFYYGFISWKKRALETQEFTYHRNSGTISLLAGLMLVIAIETYVLHMLLMKWNVTVAWIVTGLSIYSGIQIFGFLKSLFRRPIAIENNTLYLRYGILSETAMDISNIASLEISSKSIEFDSKTRKLSPLGELESHNFLITVHNENILYGLYGIKKEFKTIAFYVDDKEGFKNLLQTKIDSLTRLNLF